MAEFGDEYRHYAAHTPAFLPRRRALFGTSSEVK